MANRVAGALLPLVFPTRHSPLTVRTRKNFSEPLAERFVAEASRCARRGTMRHGIASISTIRALTTKKGGRDGQGSYCDRRDGERRHPRFRRTEHRPRQAGGRFGRELDA